MELFHGFCEGCGKRVGKLEKVCTHCGSLVFYEFKAFRNALFLVGAFLLALVAVIFWVYSPSGRFDAPVNLPLKLAAGSSVRREFRVGLDSPYRVRLLFARGVESMDLPCILGGNAAKDVPDGQGPCAKSGLPLEFRWSVSSGGRP